MRSAVRFVASIALCSTMVSAARAQLVRQYAGVSIHKSPSQIGYAYVEQLKSLRRRMLLQQQADGGTLTAEHHAMLQAALDGINASHERTLANNNPLTADADGNPNRSVDIHKNWTYATPVLTGVVPD